MILRSAATSLAMLALCASLALADPAFRVVYPDGAPRVEIDGNWSGSTYTVTRATNPSGPYVPLLVDPLLCTGACGATDPFAVAGGTYWYRFHLVLADGTTSTFGPYAATISPELARRIGVRLSPNPVRGVATVRLLLAGERGGAPIATTLALYDLAGRRISTISTDRLAPGATAFAWSPRDDRGAPLGAGVYLLRFSAADGRAAVQRLVVER